MKKLFKSAIFFFFIFISGGLVQAAEFDPDYLISDTEIADYNAMNSSEIDSFLKKQEGTLKSYISLDKEGNFKTATQIFSETSLNWMVNPKYLLVLVQKEQSLLSDAAPTQGQYDRATGYGCPDSGGCDDRWKGFYKQVNSAAAQTRYYLDHIDEFKFQPGVAYNIDNVMVTPKNVATAGLYNYTPHIHGNQLFWSLWNKYFAKKWPDGALLRDEITAKTYLIEDGKRREIVSKAVFASRFSEDKVVAASPGDLGLYEDGAPIKYLNFSLLKDSQGNIFMIVDAQKRKIESTEVFKKLGFMEDEVIAVPESELNLYGNGPNISQYTIYPAGALLQNSQTGEIYYVLSSRKRLVANQEIMNYNFQGLPVEKTASAVLDVYPSGDPVTLPDGELIKVKGVSTVYVISNGKRLPIFNAKIFENMKYSWNNVVTVSSKTLAVHPLGQTITGEW